MKQVIAEKSHRLFLSLVYMVIMVICLVYSSGCYQHLDLPQLSPHAPLKTRVDNYNRYHAINSVVVSVTNADTGRKVADIPRFLQIEDGRRIHYAEDMLPVVGDQTISGRAATKSRIFRRWGHTTSIGGYILSLSGMMGMVAVAPAVASEDQSAASTPTFWVSAGVLVSGTIAYFVGRHLFSREYDEEMVAFSNYNKSIRNNLNLCLHGEVVLDCDAKQGESQPTPLQAERPELPEHGFINLCSFGSAHQHSPNAIMRMRWDGQADSL